MRITTVQSTALARVVYDEAHTEQVSWIDSDGRARTATLPRVTFTRSF